jgi:hypothetical protein
MKVFVLVHEHYDYDDVEIEHMGVYATRELAEANQHGHMRARNKDGSVSFKTNDTRPKVWTPDNCEEIYEFEVEGLDQ